MMPIEEINERLREARVKAGYKSPIDAARAFGWNEHTYKSHENGIRGIRPDAARKYARAFRVDVAWLLAGNSSVSRKPDLVSTVFTIPVVGEVAAGSFRASDWVPREEAAVPADPREGIHPDVQYALRVDGPSVNRRIADGMFAICARLDAYPGGPKHGQLVHVVRERGGLFEHTIKEIRFELGGVALWPVSDHPDHQEPTRMAANEEDTNVQIRGVVIGKYEPM